MKKAFVGMLVLLLKIGAKLIAVIAKLGKTGFAAVTLATYSYLFTWQFALLLMFSLFVHESGHVWAMRRCGMKTRGIYFIPFVGAAAVADDAFPTRADEVFIAIMGPIWGLVLAAITGLLYEVTDEPIFAAAAGWMAMLNLFNLLPVNPLDGGRIMKSVAFSLHSRVGFLFLALGLAVTALVTFIIGYILFFILLWASVIELHGEYRRRTELPGMSGKGIAASVFVYVGVSAILWVLMNATQHVPGADAALAFLTDK